MTIRPVALPSRRRFLTTAAASTAISAIGGIARPSLSRAADRPLITHGVQSGDVSVDSGVVWARADRPSRMLVDVATTDSFKQIRHRVFVDALPETDFHACPVKREGALNRRCAAMSCSRFCLVSI
jgi:alkaline phosphatase D